MTRSQRTALWVALNAAGAVAYLYFASEVWPPAALRGLPEAHAGGDAFVWFLEAVPFVLACAVLNLVLLAWGAVGRLRSGTWRFVWWAWIIPVLWVAACSIDRYRG